MSKIRHVACVLTGNLESAVAALLLRKKGDLQPVIRFYTIVAVNFGCDHTPKKTEKD